MDKNNYYINLDPEYLEQEIDRIEGRVSKNLAKDVADMTAAAAQKKAVSKQSVEKQAVSRQPSQRQIVTTQNAERTQVPRQQAPRQERQAVPMPAVSEERVRRRNPVLVDPVMDDDDDDDDEITEEEYRAMLARKAAAKRASESAEMEESQSEYRPRRTSKSANRRVQEGGSGERRRPQGDRSSGRRINERQGASRPSLDERYGENRQTGKENNGKKRKLPIYWICLGIYALILIILGACFLSYTEKCLVQYENAQSDNAMKDYLADFKAKVKDGTITNEITIPSASGEFESADVYKDIYMAQFEGVSSYTFEKDSASYLTEEPVYDIYADDTMVAKVTLSAKNERTIFGILTIMDWDVKGIEPVFTAGSNDYVIKIPSDYKATINGVTLGESYLTGNTETNPEFVNVSQYVTMPTLVEYKVTGLVNQPEIKIYNAAGEEVAYTPDENGNISVSYQAASDEIPDEYYDSALKMAQTWEDFLTNDLSGDYHGLATIQQYLIKDSYYWDLAESYAHGVDITFISDHTLLDPPYSNIAITDYVSYGENCYSCHIYFEKNMYLTRTGETRVDVIDSTFYFVNYDDSDDGVDNPHWAIVDMIATTN